MPLEQEQEEHVRTFVKLANLTQTKQLHEWNLESLHRALQWARAAENVVKSREDVERRIRQWFPVATLPTLPLDEALTANALQNAHVHLLRSILQSPFLATHPTRSQLVVAVLQELNKLSTGDEAEETCSSISALLADQVVGAQRTESMLAIARRMSEGCKPIRVQVLSGWVEVPPLKSYVLSPRTLQLKAMAKTLQRNVVDARAALDPNTYRVFLSDLKACYVDRANKDVREVVVVMLVMCEWPAEEPEQLQGMLGDLMKIVQDWITCKSIRLWTFQPWLTALLAKNSTKVREIYVSELFETGLLSPWKREFAERVGTLVFQVEATGDKLEQALAKLEPQLQSQYFNVNYGTTRL
ncbi:hypothetical protein PHYBOEH_002378 [Phytophthora boehmeriae]|uniref:Uncharacterized protein n=1 Tax=Phytophthora boehmeriae TaxID=109152 RepID=A0A8T1X779_9STRA|nr:hypothetical protein PHYBOEH_002378 [Phytophthora boehmeriae]